MPVLDNCDCDGCLNHNIPSNTVPTGNDDPCNTSGNGVFCIGSYWLYDPDEPGADTATYGDCPRLFLRTGGDCTVDQWLEIHVAEMIVDTVPPVDGVDCCPPGTLWKDTTTGIVYISINDAGDCVWCPLCEEIPTSVAGKSSSGLFHWGDNPVLPDGNIPVADQLGILPTQLVVNNPSLTRSMNVYVTITNYACDFSFNTIVWPPGLTCSYAAQPNYLQDGVPANNPTLDDTLFTWEDLQTSSIELNYSQIPAVYTVVLPPGGTVTFDAFLDFRVQVPHNAGGGRIIVGTCSIAAIGVII